MNALGWATLALEAGKLLVTALARKAVAPITRIRSRKAENAAHNERVRAEAARKAGK